MCKLIARDPDLTLDSNFPPSRAPISWLSLSFHRSDIISVKYLFQKKTVSAFHLKKKEKRAVSVFQGFVSMFRAVQ